MKHLTNIVIALAVGCCLFVYGTTSPPRVTEAADAEAVPAVEPASAVPVRAAEPASVELVRAAEAAHTGPVRAAGPAPPVKRGPVARSSFQFARAEFSDVALELARRAGANIVLSPEVRGTVTLVTRNVPWLDVLAAAAGSVGAVVERSAAGIVRVVPASAPRRALPATTLLRPGIDPLGDTRARPRGERLVLRHALAPELPRTVLRAPHAVTATNLSAVELVGLAFGAAPARIVVAGALPDGAFDLIVSVPIAAAARSRDLAQLMEASVRSGFEIDAARCLQRVPALALRFTSTETLPRPRASLVIACGRYHLTAGELAAALERAFGLPVELDCAILGRIDAAALPWGGSLAEMRAGLRRIGIEAVRTTREIEVLLVEAS